LINTNKGAKMGKISFKFGKDTLYTDIKDEHIIHTLVPRDTDCIVDVEKEVKRILENPLGTKPLKDIVNADEKIAIIVSDITRAWIKSDKFIIHIVNYLSNLGVSDDNMFVVTALGGHRKSTFCAEKSKM